MVACMTIEAISDNALAVTLPAKLTAEDVSQLAARLDTLIAEKSHIRVLFDLSNFGGWENLEALGAHVDQLKFLQNRVPHIERIAVITAYPWQHQVFNWVGNALHATFSVFDKGQDGAARAWLLS